MPTASTATITTMDKKCPPGRPAPGPPSSPPAPPPTFSPTKPLPTRPPPPVPQPATSPVPKPAAAPSTSAASAGTAAHRPSIERSTTAPTIATADAEKSASADAEKRPAISSTPSSPQMLSRKTKGATTTKLLLHPTESPSKAKSNAGSRPLSTTMAVGRAFAILHQSVAEKLSRTEPLSKMKAEYASILEQESLLKRLQEHHKDVETRTLKYFHPKAAQDGMLSFGKTDLLKTSGPDRVAIGKLGRVLGDMAGVLGTDNSLGVAYGVCSEAHLSIATHQVAFERHAREFFLYPMDQHMRRGDMPAIAKAIKAVESDRKLLDRLRSETESYARSSKADPATVRKNEERVTELIEKYDQSSKAAYELILNFTCRLEDEQFQGLVDLVTSERDLFLQGASVLSKVATTMQEQRRVAMRSILGHLRDPARQATCKYKHVTQRPQELNTREGDRLFVLQMEGPELPPDWYLARNAKGIVGLIPADFCDLDPLPEVDPVKFDVDIIPPELHDMAVGTDSRCAAGAFYAPRFKDLVARATRLVGTVERAGFAVDTEQFDAWRLLLVDQAEVVSSGSKALVLATVSHVDGQLFDEGDTALDAVVGHLSGLVDLATETVHAVSDPSDRVLLAGAVQHCVEQAQSLAQLVQTMPPPSADAVGAAGADIAKALIDILDATEAVADAEALRHAALAKAHEAELLQKRAEEERKAAVAQQTTAQLMAEHEQQRTRLSQEHKLHLNRLTEEHREAVARAIAETRAAAELAAQENEKNAIERQRKTAKALIQSEMDMVQNSIRLAMQSLDLSGSPDKPASELERALFDAVRRIGSSTGDLVEAANNCQKAIDEAGLKLAKSDNAYFDDGTWAQGLVSCATVVAESVQNLCRTAKESAAGDKKLEAVIAASKIVNGSVQQLVLASGNKCPDKGKQSTLADCGRRVGEDLDELCQTVRIIQPQRGEATSKSVKANQAAEIEAQMRVLEAETVLENARRHLTDLRKQKYGEKK